YPLGSAWTIDLSGQEIDDEVLEALRGLDRIAELNLSNTKLTDAQLEQIAQPEIGGVLTEVDLSGTEVGDAGLNHLTSGFLTRLNLKGTKVTDAGVRQWQQQRAADKKIRKPFKRVKIER